MTTRKTQPIEVTAPATPADVVFANIINAQRDTAVVEEQALQSQKATRIGQHERDLARLHAAYDADLASLNDQLVSQANIINAADAALMTLTSAVHSNIVKIAAE